MKRGGRSRPLHSVSSARNDRHAPFALETPRGVERPQERLLALSAPERVVQERAERQPPLAEPPNELVLPLRLVLDERQELVRDRHRVTVSIPLLLVVRRGHRVEMGPQQLGHVPSGLLLVVAPGVVGAGVVHDVDRPDGGGG
jgi:hypothetical protein